MGLTFGRCRDASGPLMDTAMALYRRSFPAHELRLWPDQQAAMNDPLYHFDLCLLDGVLAGLILYWDFGAYIYVEHLCDEPSMRGHGLGTLILAELAKKAGRSFWKSTRSRMTSPFAARAFTSVAATSPTASRTFTRHIRRPTTATRSSL